MHFIKSLANPDFKNQTALITENRQFSFLELNQISHSLACRFLETLGEHNKVILCFQNQALHFIASIAAIKAGLCQIACQPGAPVSKIKKLARDTDTHLVFSDFDIGLATDTNDMAIHNVQFGIDSFSSNKTKQIDLPLKPEHGTHTALILAGSGTTGEPKLIAVDFDNLDAIMQRDIIARPLSTGDIHLSLTPVEFYTAKRRNFAYLKNGACVALRENPNTDLLSLIETHTVQHLSMAISHAQELIQFHKQHSVLVEKILSNTQSIFLGGSPIPEKIRLWFNQISNNRLYIAYGTNELGECCLADPALQKQFPDCAGKALEGVTLEIVDQNRKKLSHNTSGELRIKTKGCGYIFQAPITETKQSNPDDGNWFYPGDNAFISDEGVLVLQGRCDDAIILDGVIIYPRQIELLLENYPGILEVAAFALDINDRHLPAVAFTAKKILDIQTMHAYLEAELGWLAPKYLSQIELMPKNPAGKILKRKIKDAFMRSIHSQEQRP